MATWRVTVKGEGEALDAFKNDKENFKAKIMEAGGSATFEFPETDEAAADAMVENARAQGLEAEKESYKDPLEDAEPVSFF